MADDDTTLPPKPPATVSIVPKPNPDLPDDAPWWAKYLVSNVREAWKMLSVNLPTIAAFLIEANQLYGAQIAEFVPASWVPHIASAMLLVTAFARLINQRKPQ